MAKHNIVAFDFDGTLVDSREAIILCMQEAFVAAHLAAPSRDQILAMMGVRVEDSFQTFTAGTLDAGAVHSLVDSYRQIYAERSAALVTLYPGVAELLRVLREAQVRVGVVTGKLGAAAWSDAEHLGIAGFIEHIVGAKDVSHSKPHPEPLRQFCRFFGRYPDPATLMVGDATVDIEMGNRAGAESCAVIWGAHSEEKLRSASPTYLVKSVAELVAIL
jgi:HAD superfamily hydrolase (TIGR01549 family)